MGFLRDIFGPSKDEIWQQVANEIGGKFEDKGWFEKDVLRFKSGQWEITLDTFTRSSGNNNHSTYTRMRVPFVNRDGLRFEIYEEGIFSSIGKYFGMQDIVVNDRFFDDKYIIKGNQPERVRLLLQDENLQELINIQNDIQFSVKDDEGWFGASFPEGVDELYFECYGVMKDVDELKYLFELFSATLERLVEIDSAYETNPRIRLN
ncbi:MAG: DUF3137 domain-containing protein [Flavobacteriales bacterium]|nr:MAG: DUF3137 domain-containing protein [Flavobacteriales bacterium]